MRCEFRYGLKEDKAYRIRCMKSLLNQIIADYQELIYLWERLKMADNLEIEKTVKTISWIRQALTVFQDFRGKDIEGVSWAEIGQIAKDLEIKEKYIREILI